MIHKFTRLIIAFSLFMLFRFEAQAAITYVQDATAADANTAVSVTLNGVTAGNGLVILVTWQADSDATSPAMSGETVSHAGTRHGWGYSSDIYYVKQVATSANKTFTATIASSKWSAMIVELSGQDTTDFYDASSVAYADSAVNGTDATVNITTSVANCAIVGLVINNADNSPTVGSGYTATTNDMADTDLAVDAEYKIFAEGSGSKVLNFTLHSSGEWHIGGAAFKPAGGAPPAATRRRAIIVQ